MLCGTYTELPSRTLVEFPSELIASSAVARLRPSGFRSSTPPLPVTRARPPVNQCVVGPIRNTLSRPYALIVIEAEAESMQNSPEPFRNKCQLIIVLNNCLNPFRKRVCSSMVEDTSPRQGGSLNYCDVFFIGPHMTFNFLSFCESWIRK